MFQEHCENGEKRFTKYLRRGSCHWREEFGGFFAFNLVQHSRYLAVLEHLGSHYQVLLDWGCGDGSLSSHLLRRCTQFVGVDTEQEGLEFFSRNLAVYRQKVTLLQPVDYYTVPIDGASVDCIVCSDVIEHVRYPEKLLAEFHRLLRPGGDLIITTPHRLTEVPNDPMHVREFFPSELKLLCRDAGFTNVELRLYQKLKFYALYTLCLRVPSSREIQIGRYLLNAAYKVFGYNPFMEGQDQKTKWDIFALILVMAKKENG